MQVAFAIILFILLINMYSSYKNAAAVYHDSETERQIKKHEIHIYWPRHSHNWFRHLVLRSKAKKGKQMV